MIAKLASVVVNVSMGAVFSVIYLILCDFRLVAEGDFGWNPLLMGLFLVITFGTCCFLASEVVRRVALRALSRQAATETEGSESTSFLTGNRYFAYGIIGVYMIGSWYTWDFVRSWSWISNECESGAVWVMSFALLWAAMDTLPPLNFRNVA